jgi:DNA invertase Pin-like site-specific DNA recombinase
LSGTARRVSCFVQKTVDLLLLTNVITLVGSIAELERSLIVERIEAGMRRARMEGQKLGRAPLNIDHDALVRDRLAGMSLTSVAKKYGVSRASVVRFVREAQRRQTVAAA